MKKTNVYVDGFNLYYGLLKGSADKWLDLQKLFPQVLAPTNQIVEIKYFTALVDSDPSDPNRTQRQETYLRALRATGVVVYKGMFLTSNVRMKLVTPCTNPPCVNGPRFALVRKREEKGSDVNLAVQLLVDAFEKACEVAVVVSNDTDLAMPIEIARLKYGLTVGILNPQKKPSGYLPRIVDFYQPLRRGPVSASHLPQTLNDAYGTITKPPGW